MKTSQKGLTLLELVTGFIIIAVMVAVAVPPFLHLTKGTNTGSVVSSSGSGIGLGIIILVGGAVSAVVTGGFLYLHYRSHKKELNSQN